MKDIIEEDTLRAKEQSGLIKTRVVTPPKGWFTGTCNDIIFQGLEHTKALMEK